MKEARACLAAAQKALDEARVAHAKTLKGEELARAVITGIDAEMATLEEAESAANQTVIDAFKRGEEPPKPNGEARSFDNKRHDLERRSSNMDAVLHALKEQQSEAAAAVAAAEAGVSSAINAVFAARIAGKLEKALKANAEVLKEMPELNVGALMRLDIPGLRNFVLAPVVHTGREMDRNKPEMKLANALYRSWRKALEADPLGEPSPEAGAALLADEAAEIAKREAEEKETERKFRAEMDAVRKEQHREQNEANEKWRRENQPFHFNDHIVDGPAPQGPHNTIVPGSTSADWAKFGDRK
ncbi:MAG: hypothetical protein ACREC0_13880 [Methylocella sp.]